jgi:hypothetical protein
MCRIFVIVLALSLVSGPAWADEILDQIEFAKKQYQKGKYNKAIKELGFVINEIQAKLSKQFGKNFPAPLKGWKKQQVKSQNMGMMGGGQMTSAGYREKGGRGKMTATIFVDSPMVQSVFMMLNNPAFLGVQRGGGRQIKRVRINGEYALLEWRDNSKQGTVRVVLGGGRLMLQVKGRSLAAKKVLTDMMKAWDYDAVKKTAGL